MDAQVERLADMYRVRTSIRRLRSFSAQIRNSAQLLGGRPAVLSLLGLALLCSNANAGDRITDITVRTGVQLREQLDTLRKKIPQVETGLRYFADQKLYPNSEGLAQYSFRVEQRQPEYYSIFFIPVSAENPTAQAEQNVHLEVITLDSKGANVFLGTVSSEGKQVEVKDEKQVVGDKVEPSKDYLKRFLKCTAGACVAAAGCLVSGPAAIPCFCLSCGAATAGCSLLEYFFP
jgi:hypothetical protein